MHQTLTRMESLYYLGKAQEYANKVSGCSKVRVGSVITTEVGKIVSYGTNESDLDNSCLRDGCRRVRLYGDDSKDHRLPSDCSAIHSEIDALVNLNSTNRASRRNLTLFVTRYPCEACARAIVSSGIKRVVYGRQQNISELTKAIFEHNNVTVVHIQEFDEEDTTR